MINKGRQPSKYDKGPAHVLTPVAPISDMATIRPSIVGSLCKLNSPLLYVVKLEMKMPKDEGGARRRNKKKKIFYDSF